VRGRSGPVGTHAPSTRDVELTGDGGGKVPALARALRGRSRVARAVIRGVGRLLRLPGVSLRLADVNGGPGALLLDGQERLIAVWCSLSPAIRSEASAGSSTPDKLTHLGPVGDLRWLLRSAT
jgi:hypothetical protein